MNGLELLKEVRSDEKLKLIPFIMVMRPQDHSLRRCHHQYLLDRLDHHGLCQCIYPY